MLVMACRVLPYALSRYFFIPVSMIILAVCLVCVSFWVILQALYPPMWALSGWTFLLKFMHVYMVSSCLIPGTVTPQYFFVILIWGNSNLNGTHVGKIYTLSALSVQQHHIPDKLCLEAWPIITHKTPNVFPVATYIAPHRKKMVASVHTTCNKRYNVHAQFQNGGLHR